MDIQLGDETFGLEPITKRPGFTIRGLPVDPDFYHHSDRRLIQRRRCGNRPSEPDPLQRVLVAETNIDFRIDTEVLGLPQPVPPATYEALITDLIWKLVRETGFSEVGALNAALQARLGTARFAIPLDDLLDGYDGFSVEILSVVSYRRFWLRHKMFRKADEVMISIPVSVRHSATRYETCASGEAKPFAGDDFPRPDRQRDEAKTPMTSDAAGALEALEAEVARREAEWAEFLDRLRDLGPKPGGH